jgi:hypothetical protein
LEKKFFSRQQIASEDPLKKKSSIGSFISLGFFYFFYFLDTEEELHWTRAGQPEITESKP